MAYTPTTWNTGDTITASAMNKLENGVANAGGVMIVTSSYQNGAQTMDKTVQEIHDALMSGTPVYYKFIYGTMGTDYITTSWLAPISYIYTYDMANIIRVVVQRPVIRSAGASGSASTGYALSPAVMLFEADSVNAYPKYYRTVGIADTSTYASNNLYY